jgi:hypothetical protein
MRQIDNSVESWTATTCRIRSGGIGNRKTRRKTIDRQEKLFRPSESLTTCVSGGEDRKEQPMTPVTGESWLFNRLDADEQGEGVSIITVGVKLKPPTTCEKVFKQRLSFERKQGTQSFFLRSSFRFRLGLWIESAATRWLASSSETRWRARGG